MRAAQLGIKKVLQITEVAFGFGIWNLSREQWNKLLARQFRDDCLYIYDWSGCVHMEESRNYMIFREVFKNFKQCGGQ